MDWKIPGQVITIMGYDFETYCQTSDSVYVRNNETWIENGYNNLFEYFVNRYQITYKTIHLLNNEMFSIDIYLSEESNQLKKRLEIIDFNESKLTISSNIVRDLPKTLKSDVKCFYKYFDFESLVMNDNKVYDIINVLYSVKSVLDTDVAYSDLSEVSKLSDKNIEEFFNCSSFMFARSETNEIYS